MVYEEFLGMKKKNKSTDVIWCGFDAICVCPFTVINISRSITNENAHISHIIV